MIKSKTKTKGDLPDAFFPKTIWNGSSITRSNLHSYRVPDGDDYNQIATEVIAIEKFLQNIRPLPEGGIEGQALTKRTDNDFDYHWSKIGQGTSSELLKRIPGGLLIVNTFGEIAQDHNLFWNELKRQLLIGFNTANSKLCIQIENSDESGIVIITSKNQQSDILQFVTPDNNTLFKITKDGRLFAKSIGIVDFRINQANQQIQEINDKELLRQYDNHTAISVSNIPPNNNDLNQSSICFHLDESHNKLLIHTKYSDESFKTGEIPLNKVTYLIDQDVIETDTSLGNCFRINSKKDCILFKPRVGTDGQICTWRFHNQDPITSHLLTLKDDGFRFGSDLVGTTPTLPGKADYIAAQYIEPDDSWDVISYIKGY